MAPTSCAFAFDDEVIDIAFLFQDAGDRLTLPDIDTNALAEPHRIRANMWQ
jgi:hypothetical protein